MAFNIDLDMLLEYCNTEDAKVIVSNSKHEYKITFEFTANGKCCKIGRIYSRKELHNMTYPNSFLFDELKRMKSEIDSYKVALQCTL